MTVSRDTRISRAMVRPLCFNPTGITKTVSGNAQGAQGLREVTGGEGLIGEPREHVPIVDNIADNDNDGWF